MVGWRDEKRRVRKRRWDLEIGTCWAMLYRANGSDEGQVTSLPGEEREKSDGERKAKGVAGMEILIYWPRQKKIDIEIKYEKCSII